MIKTSIIVATIIFCTIAICTAGYSFIVGGGGVMITSQYDAFGSQPENFEQDVQERAERVGNAVNNTLSGKIEAEDVDMAIQNERIRFLVYIIGDSEDEFKIHENYINYLDEAGDVVSAKKDNQTELNNEIAQMNAAKQKLY